MVSLNKPSAGDTDWAQEINDNWTTIETSFIEKALLTTKGDLIVRDSTSPVRRAVGSDGTVLAADSNESTNLAYLKGIVKIAEASLASDATDLNIDLASRWYSDVIDWYKIVVSVEWAAGCNIYLRPRNGGTTQTSNLRTVGHWNTGTFSFTTGFWDTTTGSTGGQMTGVTWLRAKSGKRRIAQSLISVAYATPSEYTANYAGWWSDTTTRIEGFNLGASVSNGLKSGMHIAIYAMRNEL